MENTDTII